MSDAKEREQDTYPDITVSIVSFNTCALLRRCLRSLEALQASGEATREVVVRAEFPWVCLRQAGESLVYGRADNLALGDARGRYVLILNPTTEVPAGAVDPRPALPELLNGPSLWSLFCRQTFLGRLRHTSQDRLPDRPSCRFTA